MEELLKLRAGQGAKLDADDVRQSLGHGLLYVPMIVVAQGNTA